MEEVSESNRLEELMMGIVLADIAAITNNIDVEAITWEKLEAACQVSSQYKLLHQTISQGVSNNSQDWDMQLREYFIHRHALSTLGSVVLLYDRPVIPQALRQDILQHLHAGHAGHITERISTSSRPTAKRAG